MITASILSKCFVGHCSTRDPIDAIMVGVPGALSGKSCDVVQSDFIADTDGPAIKGCIYTFFEHGIEFHELR